MLPGDRKHAADGTAGRVGDQMPTLFLADWVNATFIHCAVDPKKLQPHVPFELDTRDGVAYVSLVAFTQRRLRPSIGGRLAETLSTPLACHEFLNVRTYVRNGGEVGIYFIAEWIPNRLAALIGPPLYGLPYRVGQLKYASDAEAGITRGNVIAQGASLTFEGRALFPSPGTPGEGRVRVFNANQPEPPLTPALSRRTGRGRTVFEPSTPNTLDAFLVERYTAWPHRHGVARRFRIRHAPWDVTSVDITVPRNDLIAPLCGGLLAGATPVAAHFSPGTFDVRISPPARCEIT